MSYRSNADLGGSAIVEPVTPESEIVPFAGGWQPRAFALTLAMGATGSWNIDMSRAARETLRDYRSLSYYEIWFAALEALLLERGLVSRPELAACAAFEPTVPVARTLQAGDVPAVLARGAPTHRAATGAPRYGVGSRVRMRREPVAHHTRLPGYARGRTGVVERLHGTHVFPDMNARGLGEQPTWLYTVAFTGEALWGDEASARGTVVSIDAWEPYLEPV